MIKIMPLLKNFLTANLIYTTKGDALLSEFDPLKSTGMLSPPRDIKISYVNIIYLGLNIYSIPLMKFMLFRNPILFYSISRIVFI